MSATQPKLMHDTITGLDAHKNFNCKEMMGYTASFKSFDLCTKRPLQILHFQFYYKEVDPSKKNADPSKP